MDGLCNFKFAGTDPTHAQLTASAADDNHVGEDLAQVHRSIEQGRAALSSQPELKYMDVEITQSRHLTDAPADCGSELQECCEAGGCNAATLTCITALCVPCGSRGDPACTDPSVPECDPGLVPGDGTFCLPPPGAPPPPPPCGGPDEACCDGDTCKPDDSGLECIDGSCIACGELYEPPCTLDGVAPCVRPLDVDDQGLCAQGVFNPPGPDAQYGTEFAFCCDGDTCVDASHACVEGRCYPCGTIGQEACNAEYVEDYFAPICFFYLEADFGDGLKCKSPACGGLTELCCDRTGCNDDLTCYELLCRPCGTLGQVACDYNGDVYPPDPPGVNEPFCFDGLEPDADGLCAQVACGANRGPCCEGGQCDSDDLICYIPENGGFCADPYELACGYEYAPCCGGSVCQPGLGCNDRSCFRCGAEGFPVCTEIGRFRCAPGLVIDEDGVCVRPTAGPPPLPPPPPSPKAPPPLKSCGVKLAPCCEGSVCDGAELFCIEGQCLSCGGRGQLVCPGGGRACKEGLEERSGICVPVRPEPKVPKLPALPPRISFGNGGQGGEDGGGKSGDRVRDFKV